MQYIKTMISELEDTEASDNDYLNLMRWYWGPTDHQMPYRN